MHLPRFRVAETGGKEIVTGAKPMTMAISLGLAASVDFRDVEKVVIEASEGYWFLVAESDSVGSSPPWPCVFVVKSNERVEAIGVRVVTLNFNYLLDASPAKPAFQMKDDVHRIGDGGLDLGFWPPQLGDSCTLFATSSLAAGSFLFCGREFDPSSACAFVTVRRA